MFAWEQFSWPSDRQAPTSTPSAEGSLSAKKGDDGIVVQGKNFTARISAENGLIATYTVDGRELLASPMQWNFWRALTDNDQGWRAQRKLAIWRDAGRQVQVDKLTHSRDQQGQVVVKVAATIPAARAHLSIQHTFSADSVIDSQYGFRVDADAKGDYGPDLPRLGIQTTIPKKLNQVAWYGRGPHENYWDRKSGAPIGRYASTVAEWVTPYVKPQENANRCDVRWVTFTNELGRGLRFSAPNDNPLSVSAWPYTQEDLASKSHNSQLPKRNFVTVNFDHHLMGVGGDNSWGHPVNEPYLIHADHAYEWSVRLEPFDSNQ